MSTPKTFSAAGRRSCKQRTTGETHCASYGLAGGSK